VQVSTYEPACRCPFVNGGRLESQPLFGGAERGAFVLRLIFTAGRAAPSAAVVCALRSPTCDRRVGLAARGSPVRRPPWTAAAAVAGMPSYTKARHGGLAKMSTHEYATASRTNINPNQRRVSSP